MPVGSARSTSNGSRTSGGGGSAAEAADASSAPAEAAAAALPPARGAAAAAAAGIGALDTAGIFFSSARRSSERPLSSRSTPSPLTVRSSARRVMPSLWIAASLCSTSGTTYGVIALSRLGSAARAARSCTSSDAPSSRTALSRCSTRPVMSVTTCLSSSPLTLPIRATSALTAAARVFGTLCAAPLTSADCTELAASRCLAARPRRASMALG